MCHSQLQQLTAAPAAGAVAALTQPRDGCVISCHSCHIKCYLLLIIPCCYMAGDWLLLKNLHLAVDWLPALERELYALQQKRSRNADSGGGGGGSIGGSGSSADGSWSPTFRVMLTSERHSRFPPGLLETARKVTVSPWWYNNSVPSLMATVYHVLLMFVDILHPLPAITACLLRHSCCTACHVVSCGSILMRPRTPHVGATP